MLIGEIFLDFAQGFLKYQMHFSLIEGKGVALGKIIQRSDTDRPKHTGINLE